MSVTVVKSFNKVNISHMVDKQLRWIVSNPHGPPNTKVFVKVNIQSYRDQNI